MLETVFFNNSPIEATRIANECNKELHVTVRYLEDFVRRGYAISPQKDYYVLTGAGKKILGVSPITKEEAKRIIAYAPHDKAFNFRASHDELGHMHAHSMQDFTNKLSRVDLKTIEFHMNNGDFAAWFNCLGDQELTKKITIIKEKNIVGEQLRLTLQNIIEQRCHELIEIAEITL